VFDRYADELKGLVTFQEQNLHSQNNYGYFPIVLANEKELKKVQKALNKQNIFPRRYFYPSLDSLSYIEPKQYCQISQGISKRILCLPMYEMLSNCMQDEVIKIVKKSIMNKYEPLNIVKN